MEASKVFLILEIGNIIQECTTKEAFMMLKLSDTKLLEAFNNAVYLDLDRDFIDLLEKEIKRRKLINRTKIKREH